MDEEVRASYEGQLVEARAAVQEVCRREDEVVAAVRTISELNTALSTIAARQDEILKEMSAIYAGTSALLNKRDA
ncbi:Hypothetical protein GLP15_2664 [Giardia lamblia P15]|uniref:Uncharacterized protein n=1 Tax=Giardia intestinalis (strain P15) TaxID=658858 RepID=E1F4A5_GIAIA|nr:Hypothetical protein GLP15_2664 [Giardia lamblia P15]